MSDLIKICFLLSVISCLQNVVIGETYYISAGERIYFDPRLSKDANKDLQIYCYQGRPKNVINLFQTVYLQLHLDNDNYVQYDGHTPEDVRKEYTAHHSSWTPTLFAWKQKHIRLDPFNQSCIGIYSKEYNSVQLHVIRVDYWKVILLAVGILIFVSGPRLSSNNIFYYLCGVLLGMCASFLILIYFISKLFPKRPMMYGFVVGGWAVGIYILQLLWDNLRVILTNYSNYVTYYLVATGFISFLLCYRMGPPTNPRSKNLIKWTLQTVGLILVFSCTHYQEAGMGLVVISLIAYNFPKKWVAKSQTYWKRKFPPKVKLMSNDEYYEQGVRETNRALQDLRKYCSSPECNQWKTVLKLHDVKSHGRSSMLNKGKFSRKFRFASFVEGDSHLSDHEVLDHENESVYHTEITDDEDVTDDSSGVDL